MKTFMKGTWPGPIRSSKDRTSFLQGRLPRSFGQTWKKWFGCFENCKEWIPGCKASSRGKSILLVKTISCFTPGKFWLLLNFIKWFCLYCRGRGDRMVVGFTTTCAISAYHHKSCEFEPRSWQGVLDITLCDKVCQWLTTGRRFSPGTPISSTNKLTATI